MVLRGKIVELVAGVTVQQRQPRASVEGQNSLILSSATVAG